jgi:hypothetical protein
MARTGGDADTRLGVRREKDRPALLDIDVLERRDQAAAARAAVVMEGDPFAVAVRELRVALVDDGRAVFVANGLVALAGKRAPHEVEPFGAASHFAAVFEFVAFANRRRSAHVLPFFTEGLIFKTK